MRLGRSALEFCVCVLAVMVTACNPQAPNSDPSAPASNAAGASTSGDQRRNAERRGPASSQADLPATAAITPLRIESDDPRLRQLGIPSTAESRHYRSLNDADLRARAASGDHMAKSFLVERLATRNITLQQGIASGHLPISAEGEALAALFEIHQQLSYLERTPSNAMAGYLYGQAKSASIGGAPLEPIVAGIRLAGLRGDPRASEFERQFMDRHPGLDPDRIDMYYEYGRRAMERQPPAR